MNRILIRATNWIGDAVMSLPAIRAVHQRYPAAEITLLARPWVSGLYGEEPSVHRVIPYTAPAGRRGFLEKWETARALRREAFDCAILLQNAFEAAALVSLARIPRTIGYARDGRGLLLTDAAPVPAPGAHERFYYLELLLRAGVIAHLPPDVPIRLAKLDEAAARGREFFAAHGLAGPVIGVSPGAAYGNAKRWLPERFAESARTLAGRTGSHIAVFGSEAEAALCRQVADAAGGQSFAGRTTLRQFVDCTSACHLFLSNDSGAMHIASACGTPSVTIFGSTNHITTGPTGDVARMVRQPVECSPCLLRECPIDHRCMTGVSTSRVVDESIALLGAAKPEERGTWTHA